MATQIKNYDNTPLTTIPDKSIDTNATTLELPGTGYQNYGSHVLDDLVWIMQHFARDTAPDNAIKGQIWLDTTGNILKMYNGSSWIASGSIVAAGNAPANPVVGTFWWDTTNLVLSVWNALSWTIVAPVEKTSAWLSTKNNAPDSNNVRMLGNATNRFSTVYTVNLDASGNVSAGQATVGSLTATGASNFQGTVSANVVAVATALTSLNITATNNVVVQGNLVASAATVTGATLLNGVAVAASQLGVARSPQAGYNLDVAGASRLEDLFFADGSSQNTAGSSLKASSGYQVLPSGVIIQWGGGVTSLPLPNTITLPVPFTTTNYSVTVSEGDASGWLPGPAYQPSIYGTDNRTTTTFEVYGVRWNGTTYNDGNLTYRWIAVGY